MGSAGCVLRNGVRDDVLRRQHAPVLTQMGSEVTRAVATAVKSTTCLLRRRQAPSLVVTSSRLLNCNKGAPNVRRNYSCAERVVQP